MTGKKQEVVVSTDGSCLRNPGVWGWAVIEHGGDFKLSGGGSYGTNQIAELTAVLMALKIYAPFSKRAVKKLTIQSDSMYAINCSTTWLKRWKTNNWKNSKKDTIANIQLVQEIDKEIDKRKKHDGLLEFIWVKGHNNDKYNELADELARNAALAQN
jgi:ribonuclease HI